ncbi:hypothetical protein NDU88_012236 [Pleurodeles waltl]|uniref:Uncharacterized protein n=1 Tax=Pleurodeles waltl TaxID=8319 RepID=A0AAV7R5D0_PLEWA|nr:hypothetical protein NDU88_012236 [Pleurodeles waltl]
MLAKTKNSFLWIEIDKCQRPDIPEKAVTGLSHAGWTLGHVVANKLILKGLIEEPVLPSPHFGDELMPGHDVDDPVIVVKEEHTPTKRHALLLDMQGRGWSDGPAQLIASRRALLLASSFAKQKLRDVSLVIDAL